MAEYDRRQTGTHDGSGMKRSNAASTEARAPRWDDYSDRYREDWTGKYGPQRPWTEYEDNYRFGWQAGVDDRYKARDYGDVEADLRKAWSSDATGQANARGEGNALTRTWDDVKETVREGFERARLELEKRF